MHRSENQENTLDLRHKKTKITLIIEIKFLITDDLQLLHQSLMIYYSCAFHQPGKIISASGI
jgi:hypothetical protein